MTAIYGRIAALADRWTDELTRSLGTVPAGQPVHATVRVTRASTPGIPEQLARAAAAQAVTQWAASTGRHLTPLAGLAAADLDYRAGSITIDLPADI